MPRKKTAPAAPEEFAESVADAAEAGLGVPQEFLPREARADIVVHLPVMTAVARIVLTDWNTNEQSADVFNELVTSIREEGFSGAVEVVPFVGPDGLESYLVVSGEWRVKAARLLGIPEIPASRLTHKRFSERDFQMALSIRRNNTHGKHNREKLRRAVQELATRHPDSEELRKLLVFTKAEEWSRLLGQTKEGLKGQGATPAMLQAFDEKAKNARSLADLSVIVSRLFELYKDTVPYGFMVFTYGRKEHLYVAGTKATMRAINEVAEVCRARKIEINTVLGPALAALSERLRSAAEGPAPPHNPDAVLTDGSDGEIPF